MTIRTLLEGVRIRLTPLGAADAAIIAGWQLDGEYLRMLGAEPAFPKNEQQVAEWIREGQRGRDNFLFGIRTRDDDRLIGFLEVGEVLWTHRNTWLAIGIGEPAYRGHGYGHEAMTLALEFAFHELNLQRIQLTVFGYNEAAIALYQRLGFQLEGTFREFLERDGQRHDMLLFGLLRREWAEQRV